MRAIIPATALVLLLKHRLLSRDTVNTATTLRYDVSVDLDDRPAGMEPG